MKIIDQNGIELATIDESLGYLIPDKIFVEHHEAVSAVPEQFHYEVEREYPNGGKDLRKVVDVPGVAAVPAWDEYEDVQRFVPYTEAELEAQSAPSQMDIIEAQVLYTALMTDTLLEV